MLAFKLGKKELWLAMLPVVFFFLILIRDPKILNQERFVITMYKLYIKSTLIPELQQFC